MRAAVRTDSYTVDGVRARFFVVGAELWLHTHSKEATSRVRGALKADRAMHIAIESDVRADDLISRCQRSARIAVPRTR